MSLKRKLLFPIAAGLSGMMFQLPSQALPGQTLGEVESMISRSETFPGMSLEREEWQGEVSYIASTTNDNKGVVLYVYEENNIVTSETLQYRYPSFPMESVRSG